LSRAGVPAWFDRGTRRPHPAGRACLALLACAGEGLSAARFAEYLSLGQVPSEGASINEIWVAPRDEAVSRAPEPGAEEQNGGDEGASDTDRVVAGTLRAPWRWEKLLVETAVIGGGAERWRRRLDGKARELERQKKEALLDETGGEARLDAITHVLGQLDHLRAFALPIIDTLAGWPAQAFWGTWLDLFEALVPRVLRTPSQVSASWPICGRWRSRPDRSRRSDGCRGVWSCSTRIHPRAATDECLSALHHARGRAFPESSLLPDRGADVSAVAQSVDAR
jgi:hypothetical protein